MKHIFLVKSPLQLLNAIEAKHHYQLQADDCYLLVMADRKSFPQLIQQVEASGEWLHVVPIYRVPLWFSDPWRELDETDDLLQQRDTLLRSSFFNIRRLNRLARHGGEVGYVFIGDNNNIYMRHFAHVVSHRQSVLLDDGTSTLDIACQRLQGVRQRKPARISKRLKRLAKRWLQGLRDEQPEQVEFFTVYNIEVSASDRRVKNDFRFLRRHAQTLKQSDDVYFLGSPLSEVGLMDEEEYLCQLGRVRAHWPDAAMVYVAHRRESVEKLKQIETQLSMAVRLFDFPIEYQIAVLGPRPRQIISFFTSALDNLHQILGEDIHISACRLPAGSYREPERIDPIYRHYEQIANAHFQLLEI